MKFATHLKRRFPVLLIVCLGGLLNTVYHANAQSWQLTSAPALPWRTIAASADFTKMVATGWGTYYDGNVERGVPLPIYTSGDSGGTWTETSSPITLWASIASSADGVKLVAASEGSYVNMISGSPQGVGL